MKQFIKLEIRLVTGELKQSKIYSNADPTVTQNKDIMEFREEKL